jgi:hypothetical protein
MRLSRATVSICENEVGIASGIPGKMDLYGEERRYLSGTKA